MLVIRALPVFLAAMLSAGCGAARAPGRTAMAPASPAGPPAIAAARPDAAGTCGISGLRETVLARVNAARRAGATCGRQRLPPVPALAWNDMLLSAAARHSADMARRDYFDHATPEGKRVGARATAEGYGWRTIGENIAGGDRTADAVMDGWLASEGHCRNVMNAEFNEVAVACAQRGGSTWGTYWTMVLGRRR